jgi:hypothetical protein
VGCLNCKLMKYIELKLFENIYVGSMSLIVIFIMLCIVVNSARSPSGLYVSLIFLSLLYDLYPTMSLNLSDSFGIKDPFV